MSLHNQHKWTKDEINYLRNHSNKECMEHLGMSYQNIMAERTWRRIPTPYNEKSWTAEQDQYLRSHAYKIPLAEIAEHTGRSINAVRLRLTHLGVKNPVLWTEEQINTMCEMATNRCTIYEIADKIGRTPSAVANKCVDYNVPVIKHPNFYWTPEQDQAVKDMSNQGHTVIEIANALGKTECAVRARCYKLKVVPYSKPPEWK